MTPRAAPSLALLAAVTAIGFSALHMIVPALPLLGDVFAARTADVQLVLSLYLAGIAGGQLLYGPVSDRFGRRPVLIWGLATFLAGTLLCGIAWSLPALVAGRVLEALGACAGIVLGRAIIRDVYDREMAARGLALVMMAMTLAPAVSPAIGAYLAEWVGWRAIFALLGLFGAVVLALTAARLPETNPGPVRLDLVGMAASYLALLRSPVYLGFALCAACISGSWFTFIASAPHILADDLNQPPSTYGLMILLPMMAYMLGNAITARFAQRWGSLLLLLAGRALALLAGLTLAVWAGADGLGVWMLFLPVAAAEIGDGITQPAALAAALGIHPRLAGTASGLMGFLQMALASLGSFIVGLLPDQRAFGLIAVYLGFVLAALAAAVFAVVRGSRGDQPVLPAVPAPAAEGN